MNIPHIMSNPYKNGSFLVFQVEHKYSSFMSKLFCRCESNRKEIYSGCIVVLIRAQWKFHILCLIRTKMAVFWCSKLNINTVHLCPNCSKMAEKSSRLNNHFWFGLDQINKRLSRNVCFFCFVIELLSVGIQTNRLTLSSKNVWECFWRSNHTMIHCHYIRRCIL